MPTKQHHLVIPVDPNVLYVALGKVILPGVNFYNTSLCQEVRQEKNGYYHYVKLSVSKYTYLEIVTDIDTKQLYMRITGDKSLISVYYLAQKSNSQINITDEQFDKMVEAVKSRISANSNISSFTFWTGARLL